MTDYYTEQRPWGSFSTLGETPGYKIKEIRVKPGCRLSYQTHSKRSEHWVVVAGTATAVLNDRAFKMSAGESVDVPAGAKHRVGNHTEQDLILIEIQRGSYFGEDDIVRLQDDYNRT